MWAGDRGDRRRGNSGFGRTRDVHVVWVRYWCWCRLVWHLTIFLWAGDRGDGRRADPGSGGPGDVRYGHPGGQARPVHGPGRRSASHLSPHHHRRRHRQRGTPMLWINAFTVVTLRPVIYNGKHVNFKHVNAWFHIFLKSPTFAEFHCSCDKVYHKQKVRFLLYILGQIVTGQYIPNPLD